jgi:NTE family protein
MDQAIAAAPKPTCILVLQGGGAMGAYHVGAFQALTEHRFEPDWVCGISIGAINGAIIAGNAPGARLAQLDRFWELISRPWLLPTPKRQMLETWQHALSFGETLLLGQPGFFSPRAISPLLAVPGPAATSFYDTAPLYRTLAETVDFALLRQRGGIRLSVGATDVETGELVFFDSSRMNEAFGPQHVAASGSLPPGFPPTQIGARSFWDGGCVSNSPLAAVLDDTPSGHVVVFVIDLWSATGPVPDTMAAVDWRSKQIRYSSFNLHHIDALATKLKLRHARGLLAHRPGPLPKARLDIVHIVYHPGADQIPSSDAEFSRPSIAARRAAGLRDMRNALEETPWLRAEQPDHLGCLIHRVTDQGVTTLPGIAH